MRSLLISFCLLFIAQSNLLAQCPSILDQSHSLWNGGGPDADHRQTFSPATSGELVVLYVTANGGVTGTFNLSIYSGDGILGPLLYQGDFTFNVTGTQPVLEFLIPCGQEPMLTAGLDYTFRIQGGLNVVFMGGSGAYPSGYYWKSSGAPGNSDMCFETWMSAQTNPPLNISLTSPISCAGGSDGSLTATLTGGTGPITYNWMPSGNTQTITGLSAGTYYAQTLDGNGCYSCVDTFILVDPAAITVNAGLDQSVCPGGPPITIAGSVAIATGGTWTSSGSGTFGNANSLFTTYTPSAADELAGTVTLTLTSTGNGGCPAVQDQMVLTIFPAPTITAGADVTVCDGQSVTLNAIHSPGTLVWDNGVVDGVAFTPSVGSLVYTATITDGNGCVASDNLTVTVNPYPNATLTCSDADQIICAGDLVTFSANAGFPNYTFLVDGNPVQGPGGASTWNTTSLTNGQTVTAEVESNGCSTTLPQSFTMTVNAVPVASFSAVSDKCEDGPPYTLVEGAPSPGNYQGPGVFSGIFYPDSVGVGTYTLMYIATAAGCSDTAYTTVNVVPPPNVNAGIDQTVCEGDQVTLNGAGANTFVWNQGISNGVAFTPPVGNNIYVVTGTDANGCSATDTVAVQVNQNPTLTITPDITFCLGDTLLLTVSGADTYDWDSGSSTAATYQYVPTGNVDVPVTGFLSTGCSSSTFITLTLDDPSTVDAGIDQTICEGFTVSLSATGGVSYLWNGPGVVDEANQDISFQVDTSAYYVVEVTTAFGCVYSDSLFITNNNDPTCTIATVTSITPNDDGVNDFWRIEGIESFPDNTVIIYNRWGDEIFNETGYDNNLVKWEGTNQSGETAAGGTYYFLIKIENGPTETGWLQLLK